MLVALCVGTKAQVLEQLDFSAGGITVNTYVTGINNKNWVTGYYAASGPKSGFIISPDGKRTLIKPQTLGADDVTVESINDKNTALVVATTGGVVTLYRYYMSATTGDIISSAQCTNVLQPNTKPTDINNNRDMAGGYLGISDFLFVKHDSIVPTGNQAWIAQRYNNTYATFCGGINDANKVCGYYIDGAFHCGYVYDNIAHTYNVLNTTGKRHIWDINNNNKIVGEFDQTSNNVWMGFVAGVGTGGYTTFTSLSSIFQSTDVQSIATGINDNNVIVGHFYDAATSNWKGFIYRQGMTEYTLPGFDFAQHAWSLVNDSLTSPSCWPPSYTQGINYQTNDPYAGGPIPLVDQNIQLTHQLTALPPAMDPTWKSFAMEFDMAHAGTSTNQQVKNYYTTILKPKMFDRWRGFAEPKFGGHCYGFALSSLLKVYYPNLMNSWYGISTGTNIAQIQNTNTNALLAVERALNKQLDKEVQKHVSDMSAEWAWEGLYRTKNNFTLPQADANPSTVSMRIDNSKMHHAVVAYKIRTPHKLPFTSTDRDTIFIYDSNYPTNNNAQVRLNTSIYQLPPSQVQASNLTAYVVRDVNFKMPGIRFFQGKQYSLLKSTSANEYDDQMIVGLFRESDYNISYSGLPIASLTNNLYTQDSTLITPIQRPNLDRPAYEHVADTSLVLNISTTNYNQNAMVWTQVNSSRSMGISRAAQQNETDNSTQKNAMITYGNPDNVTKQLTAFMREDDGTALQQGVNITVSNICAEQGDSIVTNSPNPYVYNVTKLNGNSTCTYHLDVYAAYNGEIIEFHGDADIQPNSSHTIDPYYVGNNGTQVAVIVDNGNDGITDDTLFVAGFPLGMKNIIDKGGIKIYPNPVQDELNVEFATAGKYSIIITDVVGKTISNNTMSVSAGRTVLPMGQYPNGMYLIQVTDEKGNMLVKDKIIKQ